MAQEGSLDFRLVRRICDLQQALDQALDSLDELQERVQDQQLVESQLAKTEKYSNVQQKIIHQLQQQLAHKEQWQSHVAVELMRVVESLVEAQQIELERLHVRLSQSQAEVQDYLLRLQDQFQTPDTVPPSPLQEKLALESEVMVARSLTVSLWTQLQSAQDHIYALGEVVSHYQTTLATLESSLEGGVPKSLPPMLGSGDRSTELRGIEGDAQAETFEIALVQELKTKQLRIDELQAELAEQFRMQTRLKQRCQELAAERDHHKRRTAELQEQISDLQTQILHRESRMIKYE